MQGGRPGVVPPPAGRQAPSLQQQQQQRYPYGRQPPPQEEGGFFGKIKGFLGLEGEGPPLQPGELTRRLPPPLGQGPPGFDGQQGGFPPRGMPPPGQGYPPAYPPPPGATATPPSMGNHPAYPGEISPPGDQQRVPPSYYSDAPSGPAFGVSPPPPPPGTYGGMYEPPVPPPPQPEPQVDVLIPKDPQVFVIEDCVVMVLRPRDFYQKKEQMAAAGSAGLQVFLPFEDVCTRFHADSGERVPDTALLLEQSHALPPQTVSQLQALAQEESGSEETYSAVEDRAAAQQAVLAREGGLHIAHIPSIAREMLNRAPLRDGVKDVLQTLAASGVPTYVFSSGFGDIAAQLLIQGGAVEGAVIPNNVRIISNFFRTTPDGTVRGFSLPIVHDQNRNATTAARHMGMPVPDRPYALVLGASVRDVALTDGLALRGQLSVGFLRMTADLPQRLPAFLDAFDAVVLGDSSLRFAQTVLDDLLTLQPPAPQQQQQQQWPKAERRSFVDMMQEY